MSKFLLGLWIFNLALSAFANESNCTSKIAGYKLVKDSIYSFSIDGNEACFFAFYTVNPEPMVDARGNGNNGDSLWFGYYFKRNPIKIYEFPKPEDSFWGDVCSLESVSFFDMNGDRVPDVTVIGSCNKQNAYDLNFPFVFIRSKGKYILDKNVSNFLSRFIFLTVADVRAFAASPDNYYQYFAHRYDLK